jgi:PAS domain S-box-containing protein
MIDVSFLPPLLLVDPRSSLQSKAILTGESILVTDYAGGLEGKDKMTFFDEHGTVDRSKKNYSLPSSAMVIPLKHNNKTGGVLQVFTYEDGAYTKEDLRRIEPLAVLIASAIERARLYEKASVELAEKNKALEEIRKISKGLEQSPNSIIITDSFGNIEYVNPYFTELTGYTVEEVYGKNPRILHSGQTSSHTHEELWKTITSGEVWHGEFLNKKKSGELYWESASIGPVFDENNNITHYIAIKQDITEKKKRDAELNSSLLEKETMLKEIHHRVKNNLQVVSSLLNMQVEHYSHPEAIEAINTSRNRVKAMSLVHENLYRSSNLMRTSMDNYIRMLVKNIYSAYGVKFERIDFTCKVEEFEFGLDTIIPLGLIINETVSNSLKHAFPAGRSGEISISLNSIRQPEGKYMLVVKDNGIGLPADFDPANSSSLGMTLITSLASQLEGTAEITNKIGTEIRIKFNELNYKSRV